MPAPTTGEKNRRPYWLTVNDKGKTVVLYADPNPASSGFLGTGIGGRDKGTPPDGEEVIFDNGEVWDFPADGDEPAPINAAAKQGDRYRTAEELKGPKGPKTTVDEAKGKTYITDPETGKTRVEPIEGWTPEPASKGKSSYVTRGKKTFRIGDDDSIAEVPELALPDEPDRVGASTLYQQQQANERQERELALQRYIADQTAAIRRGEIDAQTASKHVDQWLTAIQWAEPTRSGYLPGYEPGGSRSRAAKASGYDFDPEQYRATTYDPFRLAAAQGTPFGTQPAPGGQPGPIDPFQGAQMVDFEEMNRRVAALSGGGQ